MEELQERHYKISKELQHLPEAQQRTLQKRTTSANTIARRNI